VNESRQQWQGVTARFNVWDPVGLIAGGAPQDEYEMEVGPLLSMLQRGTPASEVASYLVARFEEHYESSITESSARQFAERLVGWFREQWRPLGAALLTVKPISGSIRERHYGNLNGPGNLWVRFDDEEVEPWVGVFEPGGVSPYCAVLAFDDDLDRAVLVIAGGQGYIVDSTTGSLVRQTPWSYSYSSLAAPGRDFMVVADTTNIWAVYRDHDTYVRPTVRPWYASPHDDRLALDGIVFDGSSQNVLVGAVEEPEGWVRFRLQYDDLVFETGDGLPKGPARWAAVPFGGYPTRADYCAMMERYLL
jgi:hypothetical protein